VSRKRRKNLTERVLSFYRRPVSYHLQIMVSDNFDLVKLPIHYKHVGSFQILYTNHCIFQYISQLLGNYIRHYLRRRKKWFIYL